MIERVSNSNDSDKDLDRFKFAKLFNRMYQNSIINVNSSGLGKLSIVVRSARDANAILNNKSLENKGLRASIPSYFVTCQEVISGISLEINEKEIVENLVILNNVYKTNPIEAHQLSRKIINKDTNRVSYVPSRSVLLTFEGRSLPQSFS